MRVRFYFYLCMCLCLCTFVMYVRMRGQQCSRAPLQLQHCSPAAKRASSINSKLMVKRYYAVFCTFTYSVLMHDARCTIILLVVLYAVLLIYYCHLLLFYYAQGVQRVMA